MCLVHKAMAAKVIASKLVTIAPSREMEAAALSESVSSSSSEVVPLLGIVPLFDIVPLLGIVALLGIVPLMGMTLLGPGAMAPMAGQAGGGGHMHSPELMSPAIGTGGPAGPGWLPAGGGGCGPPAGGGAGPSAGDEAGACDFSAFAVTWDTAMTRAARIAKERMLTEFKTGELVGKGFEESRTKISVQSVRGWSKTKI